MARILWELPIPPTDLFHEAKFIQLLGRECELSFSYESDSDDNMISDSLILEGVECFKCTYLTSCTGDMFEQAYGMLIDLGETQWLTEVRTVYEKARRRYLKTPEKLSHIMICFDDGPCYEFIGTGFRYVSITKPYSTA